MNPGACKLDDPPEESARTWNMDARVTTNKDWNGGVWLQDSRDHIGLVTSSACPSGPFADPQSWSPRHCQTELNMRGKWYSVYTSSSMGQLAVKKSEVFVEFHLSPSEDSSEWDRESVVERLAYGWGSVRHVDVSWRKLRKLSEFSSH